MNHPRTRPPRGSLSRFGIAIVILTMAPINGQLDTGSGFFDLPQTGSATWNGVPGGQQLDTSKGMSALQAMLWKYVARCALPQGQELEAPEAGTGKRLKFPGFFGMAPEWRDGTCDQACREKVSACLLALTNRTGKHVLVGILSGDPAMGKAFLPDEHDRDFPHQEGAFFGNVFANEAYACQGRDVDKGAQVKRFCAREPTTCSGLVPFVDAGRCQDACQMTCTRLSDGSQRCAAVSCKDPKGNRWTHPVTTYLRDKLEAVNADAAKGVKLNDEYLDSLDDGDSVTYRQVDFGPADKPVAMFSADLLSPRGKGHVELWLDDRRRIGVLDVKASTDAHREQTTSIEGAGITGPHDVTLKFSGAKNIGRLSAIAFR